MYVKEVDSDCVYLCDLYKMFECKRNTSNRNSLFKNI